LNNPHKVYLRLLKKYRRQGWWPLTPAGGLKPVYTIGKYTCKTEKEKLEICIGAVLTQNTAWANVERALINLNKADFISIEKLYGVPPQNLQKLIKPSGYFKQKSKKIKIFCKFVKNKYKGRISNLFKENTPVLRNNLLSLWGIGPETADSMLLYAGARKKFVIDAYTMRIANRMGWFDGLCYNGAQKFFELNLPGDFKLYNEFHALLVLVGKNYCKPKPLCCDCPLNKHCPSCVIPAEAGI
jgi:endonuclease-3 related protein